MVITVKPCFHWIGYHITTNFLQEGIEVIGIDNLSTNMAQHLYMYVGRNSNFQHFYDKESKHQHVHEGCDELFLQYEGSSLTVEKNDTIIYQCTLPTLYGEWMPNPEASITSEADMLQWVREQDAVYIGDFINELFQEIRDDELPLSTDVNTGSPVTDHVVAVWKTIVQASSR
ncbi:hypothetical protein H0266_06220 [Halobacillus locisalis]|uniref:Uncharacterized protein n=1 Tax=Halobacillus locisalis TaxID=220753 RepID=A0A838CRB7_9BACI|nr:hypothetical protein [Halobacillus locisalis]MBA2174501.1 hypothetical protein [Halobacillus locisalis]